MIIPVTRENLPDALAVYRPAWQESHRHICSPAFLESRDCGAYLQSHMKGLYLLYRGEPVGVVRTWDGEIEDLYVHPDYQGRGYGKELLAFALTLCPSPRLTVLSDNDRAIGMYQRRGFRFTDRDKLLRPGLWEREMVKMEKENG